MISGSLRAGSYNAALARAAARAAPEGVEIDLYGGLGSLPLFDDDLDGDGAPLTVRDLRDRIEEADALLVVTPEYNGSIPGVLKNAIDWASRPKPGAALRGKTVAVAGATTGQYGALWAIQDLRRVLGVAGARVVDGDVSVPRVHELVDESGEFASTATTARLRVLLDALVEHSLPATLAA